MMSAHHLGSAHSGTPATRAMKGTVDGETKRSESGVTRDGTHVSNDDKERALARLLV